MNTEQLRRGFLKLTQYSDIVLALLVVAVIALMILPLPTVMVDALIALNLSMAVSLLMLSLYIPSALSLSTFPTLLLFTTLFRLALNITTTRQILLHGDGGKIIDTFGNLVVAGNVIVGGVVFLIITIVQFMVIAKGSERVAEVGARFTLDAMPGKQMSIDADLRAGALTMEAAAARRAAVENESRLYGAMDGAMKFVKGDAMAGLIVTGVNIIGGVAVGVLQHDLAVGEALQTYAVLTIGDGLISQIPALFISITAGIIVTRVSTEDSPHLGGDIGRQVLAQPKGLLLAGTILGAFALVPGFPGVPFMGLGLLLGGVGFTLMSRPGRSDGEGDGVAENADPNAPSDNSGYSVTLPLLLDMAPSCRDHITAQRLDNALHQVRQALTHNLGVPFPGIHLRFNDQLADDHYHILLHELPIAKGIIQADRLLVFADPEQLQRFGINAAPAEPLAGETAAAWIDAADAPALAAAGLAGRDPLQQVTWHLDQVLTRHAGEFVSIQEVNALLAHLESSHEVLVREVQRVLPLSRLADILKRLVEEEISIRNLPLIFRLLVEWAPKESDMILLTEYVRAGLQRYISHKYSDADATLATWLLDPSVEETIRQAIRPTSGGSYLALEPAAARAITDAVKARFGNKGPSAQRPVLLLSMDIRRYVKKLLAKEMAGLTVLSYQEIAPEITVQPLGRIAL